MYVQVLLNSFTIHTESMYTIYHAIQSKGEGDEGEMSEGKFIMRGINISLGYRNTMFIK